MSVRICIDVERGESGFVVSPEIKVDPNNHTVSEMIIATSAVNYAVKLAAEFNQVHLKAKCINGESNYVQ